MGGSGGVGLSIMGAFALILISDIAAGLNLDVWVPDAAAALLLLVMVASRALVDGRLQKRAS